MASERETAAFHRGVRSAITWLHSYATTMNDPHAKAILNTAAFSLGVDKPDPNARSSSEHREKVMREALEPFATLYTQITATCGEDWLPDEASAMRASLSFPTAKMPVFWRDFRRAAEAYALLQPKEAREE